MEERETDTRETFDTDQPGGGEVSSQNGEESSYPSSGGSSSGEDPGTEGAGGSGRPNKDS